MTPVSNEKENRELARLRWQCRRGALELDLLFNRFLDTGYQNLDATQRRAFNDMLTLDDTLLARYFNGIETPHDAAFRELVELIRRAD